MKGSLEAGKLADMIILDRNPLTADSMNLGDIRVMESIKSAQMVYRQE